MTFWAASWKRPTDDMLPGSHRNALTDVQCQLLWSAWRGPIFNRRPCCKLWLNKAIGYACVCYTPCYMSWQTEALFSSYLRITLTWYTWAYKHSPSVSSSVKNPLYFLSLSHCFSAYICSTHQLFLEYRMWSFIPFLSKYSSMHTHLIIDVTRRASLKSMKYKTASKVCVGC